MLWLSSGVCERSILSPSLDGKLYSYMSLLYIPSEWFFLTPFYVVFGAEDTVAMRKVRNNSKKLKSVQGSLLKSVTTITKDGGGIELTRLKDSV